MRDIFDEFMDELRKRQAESEGRPARGPRRVGPNPDDAPDPANGEEPPDGAGRIGVRDFFDRLGEPYRTAGQGGQGGLGGRGFGSGFGGGFSGPRPVRPEQATEFPDMAPAATWVIAAVAILFALGVGGA